MEEKEDGLRVVTFKFSPLTKQRLARIVDAWCRKFASDFMRNHVTKTDVIRGLINRECERLDQERDAQAAEAAKKETPKRKTKARAKPTKTKVS